MSGVGYSSGQFMFVKGGMEDGQQVTNKFFGFKLILKQ
jgi:hypothetical protein